MIKEIYLNLYTIILSTTIGFGTFVIMGLATTYPVVYNLAISYILSSALTAMFIVLYYRVFFDE